MIRVVHPGSRIRIRFFLPIPYPGVKRAPDPGSATLLTTIVSVGVAPEAAEEPMETEGGSAVEPAAAAADLPPPPATVAASDPAPPPPGHLLALALFNPGGG
jgi:hypothetical protein